MTKTGNLVLTRKRGEAIVLFDQQTGTELARISVQNVQGNKVSIAINAPQSVRAVRAEIHQLVPMERGA